MRQKAAMFTFTRITGNVGGGKKLVSREENFLHSPASFFVVRPTMGTRRKRNLSR